MADSRAATGRFLDEQLRIRQPVDDRNAVQTSTTAAERCLPSCSTCSTGPTRWLWSAPPAPASQVVQLQNWYPDPQVRWTTFAKSAPPSTSRHLPLNRFPIRPDDATIVHCWFAAPVQRNWPTGA